VFSRLPRSTTAGLIGVVSMETTAESPPPAMTVVGELKSDVAAAASDDEALNYLDEPPTWNESIIPYLGDLSPKPTWEIVVKVSNCR